MKFDPGKAWPHPVLRPSIYSDDYPNAEFEVEIEVKRVKQSTAVELVACFELSEPSLIQLLEQDKARFALLVRSPKTRYRKLLQSDQPIIEQSFPAGVLAGRVELAPFLVCIQTLSDFYSDGWHSDFAGMTFDIDSGAVLAEDISKDYWIDTADEAPLGSIFGHRIRSDLPNGRWEYELDENHIWIVMSDSDTHQYQTAREQIADQPEGQYLMNGLYLPALIAVLNEIDQNAQDFSNHRWFASLDQRLESVGCPNLGSVNSNRLIDAQKILDSPFLRMPLIADAGIQSS